MNLVEAARKGAEMVDGLANTGRYIIQDDEKVLACAIGAAYIGVTGEYSEDAAAFWANTICATNDISVDDELDDVYIYNDSDAASLEDAIDYLEQQHPDLAKVVVS